MRVIEGGAPQGYRAYGKPGGFMEEGWQIEGWKPSYGAVPQVFIVKAYRDGITKTLKIPLKNSGVFELDPEDVLAIEGETEKFILRISTKKAEGSLKKRF